GYDADHPRSRGEVGKEGVSISTLDDFERLFADIPLGDVTTSMTINCTASVALAMYLAIAEKQGVSWSRVGGTMQNDMLKEFIAQKEWICPPDPAVRIVVDMIEFTAKPWPRFMKERFGAKKPESMRLRTHTQTAGVSATAQQPLNNIARVALQALAAVLGGAQSLHTNSYDETWALPTEDAVTVALRTQQIIAEESGVALTIDPLGGSYYLETLTDQME